MKVRILIILAILIGITFASGITYSIFHSNTSLYTEDKNIAKFIFDTEVLDHIELPLTSLVPGDEVTYEFSVSNTKTGIRSDVTLEYQIELKTYHFLPLNIELYSLNNEILELVMNCDESYERDESNYLVCITNPINMEHDFNHKDDYVLKIVFDDSYDDIEYSNLVDFIDLEIKSWQKID